MSYGDYIRKKRCEMNMSQESLAEKLFVSRELVSKWELGQRTPDLKSLRELAALFGVDETELADFKRLEDELRICVPQGADLPSDDLETALNGFLKSLPQRSRIVFMRRYFYLDDTSAIAQRCGMTKTNVRMSLMRSRNKLKAYLKGEIKNDG